MKKLGLSKNILLSTSVIMVLFTACKRNIDANADNSVTLTNKTPISSNLASYIDEMKIDELVMALSASKKPEKTIFKNVNIIQMDKNSILENRSVLVDNGKIIAIEKGLTIEASSSIRVIDGEGGYLIPGLVDSHVHIGESNAEKLLNILTGVTSVREMCGFDWMIPYRENIKDNLIMAPNTYVAGTMLNYHDIGLYSQVVKTKEELEEVIDEQIALGYDFIKVWNYMPEELLRNISDKCEKEGIDLVGHIPHDISVEKASALGYTSFEHFKGFIIDRTLKRSEEDYINSFRNVSDKKWLSPTFALYLQGLRGDDAKKRLLDDEAYTYVPAKTRQKWSQRAEDFNFGKYGNTADSIFKMKTKIYEDLKVLHPKYVSGTDTNGVNPLMVSGFILWEELNIFKKLGMSNYEVLKTATINPAKMMGVENQIGTIEVGKRADFIVLPTNPLVNLKALEGDRGVMVRGIWFSKAEVKAILTKIGTIYSKTTKYTAEDLNDLFAHIRNDKTKYLVKPTTLITLSQLLAKENRVDEALEIMKLCTERYPYYYAYDSLADLYLKKGDSTIAKKYYEKSTALYRNGSYARSMLPQL